MGKKIGGWMHVFGLKTTRGAMGVEQVLHLLAS